MLDSSYSYSWSGGSTNDSIIVNAGGTYWLETINTFGCMESDTVTITEYPAPMPVSIIATDTVFCSDEFVTLTAEPIIAGNIHTWNRGGGNPTSITVDEDAEVILTIEDQNGCIQYDTVQVTTVAVPYANILRGGPNLYCQNIPSGSVFQWYLDGVLIPGAIGQVYTPIVNGSYTLVVTFGICSFTTDNYYYNHVGLENLSKIEISISPNPASSEIRINNLNSIYSYAIYDASGRIVMEASDIENTTIPLIDLSNGMYVIELSSEDFHVRRKFIKE